MAAPMPTLRTLRILLLVVIPSNLKMRASGATVIGLGEDVTYKCNGKAMTDLQFSKLDIPDLAEDEVPFGMSVVVSAATDEVFVGKVNQVKMGRVYVFNRSAANIWEMVTWMDSPQQHDGDWYGASIWHEEPYLVIGAPGWTSQADRTADKRRMGAVFVYKRNLEGGWDLDYDYPLQGDTDSEEYCGQNVYIQRWREKAGTFGWTVLYTCPGYSSDADKQGRVIRVKMTSASKALASGESTKFLAGFKLQSPNIHGGAQQRDWFGQAMAAKTTPDFSMMYLAATKMRDNTVPEGNGPFPMKGNSEGIYQHYGCVLVWTVRYVDPDSGDATTTQYQPENSIFWPDDKMKYDYFGYALAMDFASDSGGTTMNDLVIAASSPYHDLTDASDAGAVYMYMKLTEARTVTNFEGQDQQQWWTYTKITAPTPVKDALFGYTLALREDTLLVGCPQVRYGTDNDKGGLVYVYNRGAGNTWTYTTMLTASRPQLISELRAVYGSKPTGNTIFDEKMPKGWPVAIGGDYVVGANPKQGAFLYMQDSDMCDQSEYMRDGRTTWCSRDPCIPCETQIRRRRATSCTVCPVGKVIDATNSDCIDPVVLPAPTTEPHFFSNSTTKVTMMDDMAIMWMVLWLISGTACCIFGVGSVLHTPANEIWARAKVKQRLQGMRRQLRR